MQRFAAECHELKFHKCSRRAGALMGLLSRGTVRSLALPGVTGLALHRAAVHDADLATAFIRVTSVVDPPSALLSEDACARLNQRQQAARIRQAKSPADDLESGPPFDAAGAARKHNSAA
jgi:hypothetical protein